MFCYKTARDIDICLFILRDVNNSGNCVYDLLLKLINFHLSLFFFIFTVTV